MGYGGAGGRSPRLLIACRQAATAGDVEILSPTDDLLTGLNHRLDRLAPGSSLTLPLPVISERKWQNAQTPPIRSANARHSSGCVSSARCSQSQHAPTKRRPPDQPHRWDHEGPKLRLGTWSRMERYHRFQTLWARATLWCAAPTDSIKADPLFSRCRRISHRAKLALPSLFIAGGNVVSPSLRFSLTAACRTLPQRERTSRKSSVESR